ncbi:MAG: RtcB family protein [Candidatus Sericytochromatia bacterium]
MELLQKGGKQIKIWTDVSVLDEPTLEQLFRISKMPFIFEHIAVMPDVHLGKGATVGSVIATKGAIMPAAVGCDIGCGMLATKTNLTAADLPESLAKLRSQIEKNVPVGFGCHKNDKFGEGLNFLDLSVYNDLSSNTIKKAKTQIGTLGGGNHFIEICLDTEKNVWVMLHSGSRNIGNEVANIHIKIAKGEMKKAFNNLEDPNLAYLSEQTQEFKNYINDLFWCQEYALKNRRVMFDNILLSIKKLIPKTEIIGEITSCHHNYVSIEEHFGEKVYVTRKGAIRAEKTDLGIIPGSMGAKSYIVRGKGNPDSFNSCSHGAGRKMTRTKARSIFNVKDLEEQTKNVECRKDHGVLDEIPEAYKDIKEVMRNQRDLVEVVTELKQILCIKG